MSEAFVWFHHNTASPNRSRRFYQELLGWKPSDGPGGLTMFALGSSPFAATGERYGDDAGWIPFVQVADVQTATDKAIGLGAKLVRQRSKGPAGEFSVVRDPDGAIFPLWQQG